MSQHASLRRVPSADPVERLPVERDGEFENVVPHVLSDEDPPLGAAGLPDVRRFAGAGLRIRDVPMEALFPADASGEGPPRPIREGLVVQRPDDGIPLVPRRYRLYSSPGCMA